MQYSAGQDRNCRTVQVRLRKRRTVQDKAGECRTAKDSTEYTGQCRTMQNTQDRTGQGSAVQDCAQYEGQGRIRTVQDSAGLFRTSQNSSEPKHYRIVRNKSEQFSQTAQDSA